MAANSVNRERYREYAHYLRLSADNLNMSVAPDRLQRLKSQVRVERNKFFAMGGGLAADCAGQLGSDADAGRRGIRAAPAGPPWRPAPRPFTSRWLPSRMPWCSPPVVVSAIMFPVAVAVAYAPIVAHARAVNDLEYAHRALKAVEKAIDATAAARPTL